MGLRPAKSHEKLSGRPVGGRDFVGQVGNLRPIGNRPLPPSRWTGGGNQPPRRLPTCPTLVFRPCQSWLTKIDRTTRGDRLSHRDKLQEVNPRTLYQVLEETARVHGDAPALRQPAPDGSYTVYSWNQYRRAAEEIAAGLRALGIAKGDVVALNSETRLEFYLADLGILTNGSIAAAMYPSYPAPDLVRIIQSSGARAVFVEDPKTLQPLRGAPASHWILLTGEAEGAITEAEGVITLGALRTLGRDSLARDPELLALIRTGVSPSDTAILYLTSGATGEPKMALVSHQSIAANVDMGPAVLPLGPKDSTVVFLPSAHIAQRVVMEFLPMRCGMPVTFFESLLKLTQDIRKVRP